MQHLGKASALTLLQLISKIDFQMTRRKKLLLALLAVVLISQIPFAYRRYKLRQLHLAIENLKQERVRNPSLSGFREYTGVIHVHSFLGGHSRGNFEEIIAAAKSNQLNFVVMTEHPSANFNTAAMTLKGMHGGVLFINGNEISSNNSDRLLVIPGDESEASGQPLTTAELIAQRKSAGALSFVAYPHEFKSWDANGYDGVEVYNVYTNARRMNPFLMFFDSLWSYRSYPDLLFANFYSRPTDSLQKWDQAMAAGNRKLVAIAGNDAHANVGISLNDSTGKTLLGLQLDPYERSFRLVRVHVLIPADKQFTSETFLEALAAGHCFIGFDLFGNSSEFEFVGQSGDKFAIQGDEIPAQSAVRLTVAVPLASRVVLFKDGQPISDETGITRWDYSVTEKGSYRVEAYLSQLPGAVSSQPWIISNPIYVR